MRLLQIVITVMQFSAPCPPGYSYEVVKGDLVPCSGVLWYKGMTRESFDELVKEFEAFVTETEQHCDSRIERKKAQIKALTKTFQSRASKAVANRKMLQQALDTCVNRVGDCVTRTGLVFSVAAAVVTGFAAGTLFERYWR